MLIFVILIKKSIIAENLNRIQEPTGQYWDDLKKLNLPKYLYYIPEDRIVIVLGIEYRKRKGKGKNKQAYFHTENGLIRHASFFRRVDIQVLNRDKKIEQLLNND